MQPSLTISKIKSTMKGGLGQGAGHGSD